MPRALPPSCCLQSYQLVRSQSGVTPLLSSLLGSPAVKVSLSPTPCTFYYQGIKIVLWELPHLWFLNKKSSTFVQSPLHKEQACICRAKMGTKIDPSILLFYCPRPCLHQHGQTALVPTPPPASSVLGVTPIFPKQILLSKLCMKQREIQKFQRTILHSTCKVHRS